MAMVGKSSLRTQVNDLEPVGGGVFTAAQQLILIWTQNE